MNNEFQREKDEDDAIEACLITWTIGFEQVVDSLFLPTYHIIHITHLTPLAAKQ